MKTLFAVLSVVFALSAALPYTSSTLGGDTKPARATWIIFSVLGVIAFVSQLSLGATLTLLYSALDTLGCMVVLVMSLKYGVGGWSVLDRLVIGIAAVGVVVSLIARAPAIALAGVILASLAGLIPTIRKTYLAPKSESSLAWFLFGVGGVFAALTVGSWQLDLLVYPLYLALTNFSIPVAALLGTRAKRQTNN